MTVTRRRALERAMRGAPSVSRFVGVYRNYNGTTWRAEIRIDGEKLVLGSCTTAEEAARLYDAEARKVGRPVNFPCRRGDVQAVKGRHYRSAPEKRKWGVVESESEELSEGSEGSEGDAPSPGPEPSPAPPPSVTPAPSQAAPTDVAAGLADLARRLDQLGPVSGVDEAELKRCLTKVVVATGELASRLALVGSLSVGFADGRWLAQSVIEVCRATG